MHQLIHRPPRRGPERAAQRQVSLAPVPRPPGGPGGNVMQALLPALGGLGMVMFLIANGNPVFLLAGLVMLIGTV